VTAYFVFPLKVVYNARGADLADILDDDRNFHVSVQIVDETFRTETDWLLLAASAPATEKQQQK